MDTDNNTQMRQTRSWSYYAAQAIIVPVRAIAPLAWLALVFQCWQNGPRLVQPGAHALEKIGVIWALLESIFSLYHVYLCRKLSQQRASIDELSYDALRQIFNRIVHIGLNEDISQPPNPPEISPGESLRLEDIPALEPSDPRAIDFRETLKTWFHKSPWSSLSKAHVLSWLSWSMFNASYEELSDGQKVLVVNALAMMERRAGVALPEEGDANNAHIKPLRLTLDPMSVMSRPLVAYLVINFAGIVTKKWMQVRYGARYEKVGGIRYLIRDAKIHSSSKISNSSHPGPPILFLHGLGVGIAQYTVFLSSLLSSPLLSNRTIIVPLQPHISQEIHHSRHLKPSLHGPTVKDLKEIIQNVNAREGTVEKGAVIVSHSNGTVLHAWLLKAHPELVKASCFVDPVTFCLWEGDVCYNFVYKKPTNGLELLMRYYVGSELGIANYIQRNFDWSSNTLFFEQIPNALDPAKTMYFLGGDDSILSAERVRRYLLLHGVRDNLVYTEGAPHGEALIAGGKTMHRVMNWIITSQ